MCTIYSISTCYWTRFPSGKSCSTKFCLQKVLLEIWGFPSLVALFYSFCFSFFFFMVFWFCCCLAYLRMHCVVELWFVLESYFRWILYLQTLLVCTPDIACLLCVWTSIRCIRETRTAVGSEEIKWNSCRWTTRHTLQDMDTIHQWADRWGS